MELLVLIVKRNVIVTIVIVTLRRGSVFVKLAQGGDIVINVSIQGWEIVSSKYILIV